MKHTKHIWRAAFLLLFLFMGGIIARHFLIPHSFGAAGYYRYDSLLDFMRKEPVHGVPGACGECHDDIAEAKAAGGHAAVRCEVCHATLASHVREGEVIAEMAINRSYTLCAYCHQALRARPASISQIDLREHLELEPGASFPREACLECHDTESIHQP